MAFGDPDRGATAIRTMERLKQTKSATDYSSDFRRIMMDLPNWDEEVFKHYYRKGLKDAVKDELVSYEIKKFSLSDLMLLCQRIDDSQYERRQERSAEAARGGNLSKKPFQKTPPTIFTPKTPSSQPFQICTTPATAFKPSKEGTGSMAPQPQRTYIPMDLSALVAAMQNNSLSGYTP